MNKVLVTGSSGFIGMHLCKSLLDDGLEVIGVDNMLEHKHLNLKEHRLENLIQYKNFKFFRADIRDRYQVKKIFKSCKPTIIVNLAAQAGVRYSLENPQSYIDNNITSFLNVLEGSRMLGIENVVYASSSSVYGNNSKIPFDIFDRTDLPISMYAVSKKTNELMAYSYSHLYGINTTGLRFFTVYGPWGRPDMAMYIFAEKIRLGEPIPVFNRGQMLRDFTFIDDIIHGIRLSMIKCSKNQVFNLGNGNKVHLLDMIKIIEKELGMKAELNLMKMQKGDVQKTLASIEKSNKILGYSPKYSIEEGIVRFISWYKKYNKI